MSAMLASAATKSKPEYAPGTASTLLPSTMMSRIGISPFGSMSGRNTWLTPAVTLPTVTAALLAPSANSVVGNLARSCSSCAVARSAPAAATIAAVAPSTAMPALALIDSDTFMAGSLPTGKARRFFWRFCGGSKSPQAILALLVGNHSIACRSSRKRPNWREGGRCGPDRTERRSEQHGQHGERPQEGPDGACPHKGLPERPPPPLLPLRRTARRHRPPRRRGLEEASLRMPRSALLGRR